jgi:hypothetical protein
VPDKTHGEQIRELSSLVATLSERVDNARAEIDRVDAAQYRSAEALTALSTRVALLEDRLGELKRVMEEGGRRRWVVIGALVGALVGSLVTGAINLLIAVLKK